MASFCLLAAVSALGLEALFVLFVVLSSQRVPRLLYILCMCIPLSGTNSFECLLFLRLYWFIKQYLNTIVARCSWSGVYASEVMFLTVYLRPSYVRKTSTCTEQVQVNLSVTRGATGRPKAVFVVTYRNRKNMHIDSISF